MAYVYVLESEKHRKFYIGSTENMGERLARHNQGYEKSTKPYRPYKIAFKQKCSNMEEARTLEHKIKKWKRRDLILKIIDSGVIY